MVSLNSDEPLCASQQLSQVHPGCIPDSRPCVSSDRTKALLPSWGRGGWDDVPELVDPTSIWPFPKPRSLDEWVSK